MYPFRWRPAEGERHATTAPKLEPGTQVEALYGDVVELAVPDDLAWLWPTCVGCDKQAHVIAEQSRDYQAMLW